jgi:hypothetical protein
LSAVAEAVRFAAHVVALDREATGAAVCAESIRELARWVPELGPGSVCEPRAALG